MPRHHCQFTRLMKLDESIRNGEYPNCRGFAEKLEVASKTIQRDIEYLRDTQNAPIQYDPQRNGYYYTDQTWFLPAVFLSEGELLALLMASRALEQYQGTPVASEIKRVFQKIIEFLPDQISIRPEFLFNHFTFTSPPAKPVKPDIWVAVIRGLLGQKTLRITYGAFEATEPRKHDLNPYHVANLRGEWYVYGLSHLSGKITPFSLARIMRAVVTKRPFTIPAEFDPQQLFKATFGRFAMLPGRKAFQVKLRFEAQAARWVMDKQWNQRQTIKRLSNGDIELSFPAAGLMEVQHWVMAWGRHVKVLAPTELRDAVKEEIRQMAVQAGFLTPDTG